MIQIKRQQGRIDIELAAHRMGKDLCVLITGGVPHLGALTAASESLGSQSIVFDDHQEYHVTEMAVRLLRGSFDGNVVVCCGIHLDDIEKHEIAEVMKIAEEMIEELCIRLKKEF